jgi:hypothetical protein
LLRGLKELQGAQCGVDAVAYIERRAREGSARTHMLTPTLLLLRAALRE